MTYIETGIAVADIARVLKTTVPDVESEAESLDLYIGTNWSGAPAVSELDAHGIVSGDARRAHEGRAAWRSHESALEQHEHDRETARLVAYREVYDREMRRGIGSSAATQAGHDSARSQMHDWDASNPAPTFNPAPTTAASWIRARVNKAKAGMS